MERVSAEEWKRRATDVEEQVSFKVKIAEGQPPAPLTIRFPLPDNRALMYGPVTYKADGLATTHATPFFDDAPFCQAVGNGLNDLLSLSVRAMPVHWRAHVAVWAARNGLLRDGDFVECGVNTGLLSGTVIECLDFGACRDRCFFLLDTFSGVPDEQMTIDERGNAGISENNRFYRERGEMARAVVDKRLGRFENVRVIQGAVPGTLDQVDTKAVAYLSIDMNVAEAEVAAIRHFWPLMTSGAFIVLDDYAYGGDLHVTQRQAIDALCVELGVPVLALPTGQGLIQKP